MPIIDNYGIKLNLGKRALAFDQDIGILFESVSVRYNNNRFLSPKYSY